MVTTLSEVLLQAQLDTIDLLLAMYAGEDEISLSPNNARLLDSLRGHLDQEEHAHPVWEPEEHSVMMKLAVTSTNSQKTSLLLSLMITIPLVHETGVNRNTEAPPAARLTLERTSGLTRKAFEKLVAGMPVPGEDGIFETVEYLQTAAGLLLDEQYSDQTTALAPECDTELTRVWFYLPSLSTRGKRDDMVSVAPTYGLTGFVLAGKPGVLCVEGASGDVQAYLADIKRNSWGDIPSFQKKISERFREDNIINRKFCDMREITDDIERHGQRCNRSNLAQVEEYLRLSGLPDAFGKVFMQRD
ncbi:Putative uncharacterized protein [Taphrina deformans PYCC 5710]|uniref:Small nuclear ribonucleoprotein Prp3 C-terminal domain-containing protein n=1 Tax=Taphrina deformans (strain PYCC 5710 / ATCC 11124 / CBS 356.35 / IMI 108563 / JCM 9778 / NBRC 8474) TaxID=1097556 RepID=R4XLD8_TAPDE|nr:Putative uncharacterized protein [Taphrina deformans PYCC 5710]|eukprot:CCG85175.1 Putative uncharacterized protein [Taphrina deformans PYCC 5710]